MRERLREKRFARSSLVGSDHCCWPGWGLAVGVVGTRFVVEAHYGCVSRFVLEMIVIACTHLRAVWDLVVVHPRELVNVVAV